MSIRKMIRLWNAYLGSTRVFPFSTLCCIILVMSSLLVSLGFWTIPIIPQRAVSFDVKHQFYCLNPFFSNSSATKAYGKSERAAVNRCFGGGTAKDAIFEQQSLHLAQKAFSYWIAGFALRRAAGMLANGKTMGAEKHNDTSISVSQNDGRI